MSGREDLAEGIDVAAAPGNRKEDLDVGALLVRGPILRLNPELGRHQVVSGLPERVEKAGGADTVVSQSVSQCMLEREREGSSQSVQGTTHREAQMPFA